VLRQLNAQQRAHVAKRLASNRHMDRAHDESLDSHGVYHIHQTQTFAYSTLFIEAIAASASESWEKRTKPKPRLRPVSRSLTTVCFESERISWQWGSRATYRFLDLAKFLEFGAEGVVIGVPGEAAGGMSEMVASRTARPTRLTQ
jgi:hypothetical protein